jgi:hypothetical protein
MATETSAAIPTDSVAGDQLRADKRLPTQAEILALLDYCPIRGVLTWRRRDAARPEWNSRYAGKYAGTPHNMGYVSVRIYGVRYLAHRIIWVLLHGSPPDGVIDHINGDRSDNRPDNLRDVTSEENCWNTHARAQCGYKGVRFHSHNRSFQARITHRGRERHIGYYPSAEAASEAYQDAARRLRGPRFAPHVAGRGH